MPLPTRHWKRQATFPARWCSHLLSGRSNQKRGVWRWIVIFRVSCWESSQRRGVRIPIGSAILIYHERQKQQILGWYTSPMDPMGLGWMYKKAFWVWLFWFYIHKCHIAIHSATSRCPQWVSKNLFESFWCLGVDVVGLRKQAICDESQTFLELWKGVRSVADGIQASCRDECPTPCKIAGTHCGTKTRHG